MGRIHLCKDVDGDGDIDVPLHLAGVMGSYGMKTLVLTLLPHTISTAILYATSVLAVDLDGDGDIDVLSASDGDSKITWHENDGAQNFILHTITTTAYGAASVLALDIDGDGTFEVIANGANSNKFTIYDR